MSASIFHAMLEGFVNDPPDSDFQIGYLCCLLTISNEIFKVPANDPVWAAADELTGGKGPVAVALAEARKKVNPFRIVYSKPEGEP